MTTPPDLAALARDAILAAHGVPEPLRRCILRAYETFSEVTENAEVVADWTLSGDDYYDFLESWRMGHRRLRSWICEPHVGATVTLTNKGAALFRELAKAEAR